MDYTIHLNYLLEDDGSKIWQAFLPGDWVNEDLVGFGVTATMALENFAKKMANGTVVLSED